jgi:hypothetical protein
MALINGIQTIESLSSINSANATKGNVLSFNYMFFSVDPYPTIITTGVYSDFRVSGVNLHYISFPIFRALLNQWAGNPSFSYSTIKNQPILKQAFRTYKLHGIRNAKKINYKAILNYLSIIRNYSPQEMQQIKDLIDTATHQRSSEIISEIVSRISEGQ